MTPYWIILILPASYLGSKLLIKIPWIHRLMGWITNPHRWPFNHHA